MSAYLFAQCGSTVYTLVHCCNPCTARSLAFVLLLRRVLCFSSFLERPSSPPPLLVLPAPPSSFPRIDKLEEELQVTGGGATPGWVIEGGQTLRECMGSVDEIATICTCRETSLRATIRRNGSLFCTALDTACGFTTLVVCFLLGWLTGLVVIRACRGT